MTPQEAIGFIKSEVQIDVRFCSDEKVDKTIEVFELAISALEKQIAKEHHHTKVFRCNSKARESICPSCLGAIITAANEYPKHCTWCGQKIDWSDTE